MARSAYNRRVNCLGQEEQLCLLAVRDIPEAGAVQNSSMHAA